MENALAQLVADHERDRESSCRDDEQRTEGLESAKDGVRAGHARAAPLRQCRWSHVQLVGSASPRWGTPDAQSGAIGIGMAVVRSTVGEIDP